MAACPSPLPALLPDPGLLHLDEVSHQPGVTVLTVTVVGSVACCPSCGAPSAGIHSWYSRTLRDLPCHGTVVRMYLRTRRFYCAGQRVSLPRIHRAFGKRCHSVRQTNQPAPRGRFTPGGRIDTIAGGGALTGDNVPALSASLTLLEAIAIDGDGIIYFTESDLNRVRLIDKSGMIRPFAGSGVRGFSGDGDAAIKALLYFPEGVTATPSGDV